MGADTLGSCRSWLRALEDAVAMNYDGDANKFIRSHNDDMAPARACAEARLCRLNR